MEFLKKWKPFVLIGVDIILINLSYFFAYYFVFKDFMPQEQRYFYLQHIGIITAIYISMFYIFRLYRSLWFYASLDEFLFAVAGCLSANLLIHLYSRIFETNIPENINILSGIFTVILVVGFRLSFRVYRRIVIKFSKKNRNKEQRVMIIGAGAAGNLLVKEMRENEHLNYHPVVFIDDSKYKQGRIITGVKVCGRRQDIPKIVEKENIDTIIIAIPSIDKKNRKEILDICKNTNCKIKILPGFDEMLNDKVSIKSIRDVEVEDLLGREPVKLDMEGIAEYIENKRILVTGGGGSIGSELCRQIARFKPYLLVILDIYENNAYDLQNELKYKYPELNLRVMIASIRDRKRLENIFEEIKPDVVFHAAAHKHVPLMEDNPSEAIKNNIFGTLNVAECADKFSVKRFVMISTDKAVNPTNVMGATKRVCEMIIQSMDRVSKTEFVAVRFGNVLGSNGSVIPLFKKQISQGGPVTLTHREITRFFMTIPEAAQLVLQAGALQRVEKYLSLTWVNL
ncbi:hypothetical protein Q428_11960 [Fervidicella metallireducens AeB]|uniref:Polysaccharide biosynthesis protein CapD-like domain-containing protein n=1 Tax=Fervidicella metallireducens AeB TaxID=1403537 RepID=A0A017RT94_9CLOT|nr:hypothetical protein Q428_11960 [Fervidicella metallireducens AeB]